MLFPFVNPWMLAGLAAVAIPLLVRFLTRREYVVVPWGAMQFLASAGELRSRFSRNEWLLLAIRMGAVALLALAFARPWLPDRMAGEIGSRAHRDVVLVVDGSASMSANAGGKTPHTAAIQQARQILDQLTRGDTVTLIDAREEPRIVTQTFEQDFDAVRERIQQLSPPRGPANLARAVTRGFRLLDRGRNLAADVIVLTDGQRAAWPLDDAPEWGAFDELLAGSKHPPRVFVLDVNGKADEGSTAVEGANRALGPLWLSRAHTAVGLPVRIGAALHSHGPQTARGHAVHLEIDGRRQSANSKEVIIDPEGDGDVEFEVRFDSPGNHAVAIVLDGDDRPADDRAECSLPVSPPISVLVIDGDPRADRSRSESFYTSRALGNAADGSPWLKTSVVDANNWQPAELAAPAVVILANVPRVSEPQAAWLAEHVARGGGLLVAPGDRVDAAEYNRLLFRSGEGVLPAALQTIATSADVRGFETLDIASLQAPWSSIDSRTSDLAQAQFTSWWRVDKIGRGVPVATLKPSGHPLLLSSRHGRGRVLQMAVPLDADWSNLPTRRAFVPLLHEMLLWLAAPESDASLEAAANPATPASLQRAAAARAEASVTKLDDNQRQALAARGSMEFVSSSEALADRWMHGPQPMEYWRLLIFGAAALLIAESLLTHRFAGGSQSRLKDAAASTPSRNRAVIGRGLLRLGVAALLCAIWFEPAFRWVSEHVARGRIVVAVDLSESMQASDPRAVSGLDLPPEDWIDSRADLAAQLIANGPNSWLARLPNSVEVDYVAFGGDVDEIDPCTFRSPARESNDLRAPPGVFGKSTDLAEVLSWVGSSINGLADSSDSPLAIVLLTDGRDTEKRDPILAAEKLARQSTRVIPIQIGSDVMPRDLAVASVDAPRIVFSGESARITEHLITQGFEGTSLRVEVRSHGGTAVTRMLTPTAAESSIRLELPPTAPGLQEYVATVRADGVEEPEENNTWPFSVQVVDDKARVMMLEGEARWEFRFLDGALGRDEHIDWKPIVFRQPYLGVLPETFFPRRLEFSTGNISRGDSPFANADLVIVGDVASEDLSSQGWSLLESFVAEMGGTLALISGKQHFPQHTDSPIAKRLLPVTGFKAVSMPGDAKNDIAAAPEFHLQPTPAAADDASFRFADDPARNCEIWSELPGHSWGLTGRPKPGAWVLATAASESTATSKPAHSTAAANSAVELEPVIVAQHYGLGQVVWLGIDSTWRWRRREEETYHHQFWSRMARTAARNKSTFGTGDVRFGPVDAEVAAGEEVVIRARMSPSFAQRLGSSRLRAEIRRATENSVVRTWELETSNLQPLVREARGRSLPEGEYNIQLTADLSDPMLPDKPAPLKIRAPVSRERITLRADGELLARIAAAGNGEVLRPNELDRLAALIPLPQADHTITRVVSVWNHPVVLLLLFTLLATEWGLRKRAGLP